MRTGAIFARGSCRALKWMALFGVVLALGAGSAIAQAPAPQNFSVVPDPNRNADGATQNTATQGAVMLSWTEPSDSATVTHYQWSSNGGGTWTPALTDPSNATLRQTQLTGLTAGADTVFALRAVHDTDGDGTSGETGEISAAVTHRLTVIGIPITPSLTATAGDEQVMLSWTVTPAGGTAAQPVVSYEYRYASGTDASAATWIPTTGRSATVSSLTNGQAYVFQVRSVNGAGESATPAADTDAAQASATPLGAPSAPTNLRAATPNDGEVVLTWGAPSNTGGAAITGYEYRVDGTAWRGPLGEAVLTVTLANQKPHYEHVYDVRAIRRPAGATTTTYGAHASVTATPTGAAQEPTAPQNLMATPGDGEVTLMWEPPANDGGGDIELYNYRVGDGTWMPNGLALTATVTGLTNGQSYTFEVQAVNSAGPSSSNAMVTSTPGAVPGMPQGVTAAGGNGSVTLAWMAPADNGGSPILRYEYDVDADGAWKNAGSDMTETVTGLMNGTSYIFRVRAVNAVGAGMAAPGVRGTPMAPDPGPQVTVKSVSTSTSVMESGGLTVTVTMNVPAGTKGEDDKVAPIASKMVYVTFPTDGDGILARDMAEAGDTTLVGSDFAGGYTWTKIARTEKDSEVKRTFRVAIGQDLDAEDEKFQVSVQIDGDPKRSKVITIDDAEEQEFKLTLTSDEKAKNTIKEGDSGTLKLEADPDKTVALPVTLVLDPNDPAKYSLGTTSGTLAAGGSVTSTVSAEADGDREDDTITVMAYTSGTLGNDVKLAELEITVSDVNALPAVMATIVDDKGKAVDPQPESVMEGETVKVMLTVVDKDGKAMEAAEKLTVSLMPSSGDSQDYRLSTHPIVIESGKESSASVDLMIAADDDLGMEMLVFDASVSGDAKIGTEKRAVNGFLSLAIEDGTEALVSAKSQEEVEAAVYAAKEAGMGDDMTFNPGEMIEVMGGDLFTAGDGVTVTYTAESDMSGVASASVSGGMVMVTAMGEGMAHITITAHASMPSGVKILDQTDPRMASIVFPVEVGLEALSIMLMGPEDENLAEGMSAMVTATANRAVTEDTMVML
ncbi:MAG: fibronectin type III domain-containing protein, partial [Gammaproteobacteria bacterium]|nr:fibronectin type III domain-containing protein [Gammaproteobacteria bacterium]